MTSDSLVEKSPLPLFSKEGFKFVEENSPFEKGITGGFVTECSRSNRLALLE
jgi:hypothetical protein